MAKKWIDSAFEVKMKELEHQYALIQQRENVKYAKTFESRWEAFRTMTKDLVSMKECVKKVLWHLDSTWLHKWEERTKGKDPILRGGIRLETLTKESLEYLDRIPDPQKKCAVLVAHNAPFLTEAFLSKCNDILDKVWRYHYVIDSLRGEQTIELNLIRIREDAKYIEDGIEEILKMIREMVGGDIT
ncbi:MAG: hypothetical protein IPM12_14975 [Flavobacteriales bacterium]|nr:hypothetical protein [Flavobacteriales bacterium]